ncbi:MAG: TonB-dependent receptor plug domain-containing protein [Bacteroidia bacterium]|nr:TonB-dependent receptor plug domain-containing protein [Bacteroidia bacterium]
MKRTILFTLLLLSAAVAFAQNITLSGYVKDLDTGEPLIGASVFETRSGKGSISNEYGFYSLTLPSDSIVLRASYVGFQAMEFRLKPTASLQFMINLKPNLVLDEVQITASELERIEEQTQMSTVEISMEKVKALPVLLGEKDILKTIQLMPGVQSGSEGSSGIYVRGGGTDQNLILLDGVPIYNASHLFGFFSVFNADAINSVKLIKGGFPARYGGRLSSVLDIRMKEGNMKKYHAEGTVGIVASKLTIEGPIVKDKTSFIVSGRRTYIDLLSRPFIALAAKSQGDAADGGYYFWDLNAKVNHKFSENSRLYASGYFGRDRFFANLKDNYQDGQSKYEEANKFNLNWGNAIFALRWNRILSPKLFANVTGTYSQYQFGVGINSETKQTINDTTTSEAFVAQYLSGIRDLSAKVDFDYLPSPNHTIRFGGGDTYHTFTPGVNQLKYSETDTVLTDTTYGSVKQFAHEHWVYIEDDWEVSARLKINGGLHFSGFLVGDKWYASLQPRIAARFLIDDQSSIKASYARMTQFLHLLTNPSIGLPTDLWVPVTKKIGPQWADQWAIGYARSLPAGFQVTVEAYYKEMHNVIDYKEGSSFLGDSKDWQDKVVVGRGNSYGAEFLLERKIGKTSGWIGYTLSWTNRQFDDLNFGKPFPYRYDRRHDIGLAVTHTFNENVDIGLVWVYGTGNAITLGQEQYGGLRNFGQGFFWPIEYYGSRNSYRMPSYHRLDIGVNLHKKMKRHTRTWSFGLYNAYSRQNPFFLYFKTNNQNQRGLYQISLFPVIPSVSYSFKF